MNKKQLRGIPAPFHAAVIFTVFFSLLGSPLSKGIGFSGGIRDFFARVQALFYDTSEYSKGSKPTDSKSTNFGPKKGGRRISGLGGDPVPDPPPPPPPK